MMNGLTALDKHAYKVVTSWYQEVDFNPTYKGINYSHLIRYYLWDKVGRALRIQNLIDYNELESYLKTSKVTPFYHQPLSVKGAFKKKWWTSKKTIFIPFQPKEELVSALQAQGCSVISKQRNGFLPLKNIIVSQEAPKNDRWSQALYTAVIKAFEKMDVRLVAEDKTLLAQQIAGCVAITHQAEKELKKYKPDGVYLHSDNHPPYINYVLVAKKLGIPSFTYQHGLDCEQYYLDDCFADHVAVWSDHRKQRYINDSEVQPLSYQVVGALHIPETPKAQKPKDKRILFVTRPHSPIKCYSPSRNHLEGAQILESLLKYLKDTPQVQLVIKPHPMDCVDAYEHLIQEYDANSQVTISSLSLHELLPEASVVVSEDSTAGAEAMLYHLPLVQAHFAQSNPVLPFVAYGAAYPARNPDELIKSVSFVFEMEDDDLKKMQESQDCFLQDFLPKGDVKSLADYICQNI